MNLGRRSFMGSILALAAAPAIVRADSLMRIVPIDTLVLWDDVGIILYGDGVHDDTKALQALINGAAKVVRPDGTVHGRRLIGGAYRVTDTLQMGQARNFEMRDITLVADVKGVNQPGTYMAWRADQLR